MTAYDLERLDNSNLFPMFRRPCYRMMALCDALESRLKERAGVQGKMAGAVVKQVA